MLVFAVICFAQAGRRPGAEIMGTAFLVLGLGLPLTRSLTELHGGSLTVESAMGVGTRVTVRLPPARVIGAAAAPLRRVAGGA